MITKMIIILLKLIPSLEGDYLYDYMFEFFPLINRFLIREPLFFDIYAYLLDWFSS